MGTEEREKRKKNPPLFPLFLSPHTPLSITPYNPPKERKKREGTREKSEVVNMAARLTDRQKKKIVADYLESGSLRAAGRKNGVCGNTVKRIVEECSDIERKIADKKDQNTADILAYMESKRQEVCGIIDIGLSVLPGKIRDARTASEVTTALGTLIDKFTANGRGMGDTQEKDPLSKSLEEMAKGLESDG